MPGGIGFGLGQALIGRNRRISYYTGETKMYGKTDDPEFSHIEGYEDHAVNLLCTYDAEKAYRYDSQSGLSVTSQ